MKTRFLFFLILTVLTVLLFAFGAEAQSGTLKGKVIDEKTKEPVPFASVVIELNGKQFKGASADIDGNYIIDQITPGIYNIRASMICYNTLFIKDIEIKADTVKVQILMLLDNPTAFPPIIDYFWKIPLISIDPAPSGQTYNSEDIKRMPW